MPKVEWKPTYNTDINEIDDQHKKLIEVINELYDCMEHKTKRGSTDKIFSQLFEYAETHFATEEKYMKQFNFDKYEDHVIEHKYFKKHLNDLKEKYPTCSERTIIELLNFLKDWFLNHVIDIDKEYVLLFKANGLK